VSVLLRLSTVAGLVVDAVIHLQLAPVYQLAAAGGIGQGNLFRIEAVLAFLMAVTVLLRPTRIALAGAAGGLAAVLLYRYVDVPALGPIPSTYEPLWFAKKTVTAVAGAAAAGALIGFLSRSQSAAPR